MVSSQQLISAFNQQVGNEMGASKHYDSIASHFDTEELEQLAAFFYRPAEEERDHAMRFVKYVDDAGGRVEVPEVPAPTSAFASAEAAVERALTSDLPLSPPLKK
jgi:ferritin